MFKKIGIVIVFILLWEMICRLFNIPTFMMPLPSQIISSGYSRADLLWLHSKVFILEVIVSFIASVLVGFTLAFISFYVKLFDNFMEPAVVFFQSIPRLALAPIIIILLGFGFGPKIFFAVFMGFIAIYFGTLKGFRSVDPNIIDVVKTYNISKVKMFKSITIPSALPDFFSGLKISVPAVMGGVVIGEWMVGDVGLGYLVFSTINMFDVPLAFAAVVILATISVILFNIVCLVERMIVK